MRGNNGGLSEGNDYSTTYSELAAILGFHQNDLSRHWMRT